MKKILAILQKEKKTHFTYLDVRQLEIDCNEMYRCNKKEKLEFIERWYKSSKTKRVVFINLDNHIYYQFNSDSSLPLKRAFLIDNYEFSFEETNYQNESNNEPNQKVENALNYNSSETFIMSTDIADKKVARDGIYGIHALVCIPILELKGAKAITLSYMVDTATTKLINDTNAKETLKDILLKSILESENIRNDLIKILIKDFVSLKDVCGAIEELFREDKSYYKGGEKKFKLELNKLILSNVYEKIESECRLRCDELNRESQTNWLEYLKPTIDLAYTIVKSLDGQASNLTVNINEQLKTLCRQFKRFGTYSPKRGRQNMRIIYKADVGEVEMEYIHEVKSNGAAKPCITLTPQVIETGELQWRVL